MYAFIYIFLLFSRRAILAIMRNTAFAFFQNATTIVKRLTPWRKTKIRRLIYKAVRHFSSSTLPTYLPSLPSRQVFLRTPCQDTLPSFSSGTVGFRSQTKGNSLPRYNIYVRPPPLPSSYQFNKSQHQTLSVSRSSLSNYRHIVRSANKKLIGLRSAANLYNITLQNKYFCFRPPMGKNGQHVRILEPKISILFMNIFTVHHDKNLVGK